MAELNCLNEEILKKQPHMQRKKKNLSSSIIHPVTGLATIAKLHKLHFELLLQPPYSPDLTSSDFYLLADQKKMLVDKRFFLNEEVIAETNAYFEAKDNSFFKKRIQILERCWNYCIILKGDYVDE